MDNKNFEEIIIRQQQQLDWYAAKLKEMTNCYYPKTRKKQKMNFIASVKMSLKRNGLAGSIIKTINPLKLYYFIKKHLF